MCVARYRKQEGSDEQLEGHERGGWVAGESKNRLAAAALPGQTPEAHGAPGPDLDSPELQLKAEVLENSLKEISLSHRGPTQGHEHIGVPIKFSNEPAQPRFHAPAHGQHTDDLLGELGYQPAQITDRRDAGIGVGSELV